MTHDEVIMLDTFFWSLGEPALQSDLRQGGHSEDDCLRFEVWFRSL